MSAFQRLANLELQLIMHGLPAKSLLQFARCNKILQRAACSPFAWEKQPLTCVLTRSSPASQSDEVQHWLKHYHESVQRYALLHIGMSEEWSQVVNATAKLNRCFCIQLLDLRAVALSRGGAYALFEQRLPRLEELRLGARCAVTSSTSEQLLRNAPHLHTLHAYFIHESPSFHRRPDYPFSQMRKIFPHLFLLTELPSSLTSLTLHNTHHEYYSHPTEIWKVFTDLCTALKHHATHLRKIEVCNLRAPSLQDAIEDLITTVQ